GTVEPGFPGVLAACDTPVLAPGPDARTLQRRLSLARWMTGPKNPLVARVIVNRLWQGHFGEGLVTTESDFGVMGSLPSNPELLDWLANELRAPSTSPPVGKGALGGSGDEPRRDSSNSSGSLKGQQGSIANGQRDATPPAPPLRRGGNDAAKGS